MTIRLPWLEHYPKEVNPKVTFDENCNIISELKEAVDNFPKSVAFYNMGKKLTFEKVEELSNKFATYLQNYTTLEKGDHVAIQLPNLLQYPIVLFGILKAGMVAVNTNPLYTTRELQHQYKDSKVKALVVLENFAYNVEKIIDETEIKTVIISKIGDLLGSIKGRIVNQIIKHIKKMVPKHHLKGVSLNSTLAKGGRKEFRPVKLSGNDIALLQYTGGTTGISKGAILLHKNIVANIKQAKNWMVPFLEQTPQNIIVTPLPLYHIFSLTVNCLTMFSLGFKNVLITNPRNLKGFIKELRKHKFSLMTGVNTLFNALLTQKAFQKVDFSSLRICCGAGMAVQDYVAREWERITGSPLIEGYGLSESSPALTFNPLDGRHKLGSIGLPLPDTIIEIRDEQGNQVPYNQIGEICAYGPQVMSFYWNNTEDTAKTLKNGWLYTGDMGVMDEEGFIRIVDRKKDMINISGFNVFPLEIENVIVELEDVLEVAAVGIKDEYNNESVKLFVVKKNEKCTEEMIFQHCKKNLTGYKRPKLIEFRASLPKNNVGKILKRVLKEENNT